MIPKFNIGDIVRNNGIKGSISAIELDSMITANIQPYYVVKMEYEGDGNVIKLVALFTRLFIINLVIFLY